MIFDCFIFYNELELLKYRLSLLKETVDYFVLVESKFTFAGNPKELYYNKDVFKDFNIIHILVENIPYPNPTPEQVWKNEKHQRNCISLAFDKCNSDDYIIISDVDEIPDPETLKIIKNKNTLNVGQFEQDFYYYNLESRMDHQWYFSKILRYSFFREMGLSCDSIRYTLFETIPHGGWHLSYFGTPDFIRNKIQNFSHQEYNVETFTNVNSIKNKIENKIDLFNRPINLLPPNKEYLPPNFKKNKFYCFIHSCNLPQTGTKMLKYLLEQIKVLPFEKVFVNNIGVPIEELIENIELTNYSEDTNLFEIPTINKLREFSINNPGNKILYLHTKGITRNNICIQDWINMMLYFLLQPICLDLDYDTIGCNYHDGSDNIPKHYSGNFWWATTDYLATLPVCGNNKCDAEFWLHKCNPRYYSLHNSKVNHYHVRYNSYRKKCIGFHASGHLCERGTDVAMFDYAYFNQKINGYKSIIFYEKNHPCNNTNVIEKFKKEFEVKSYTSFDEINNYPLDYFYNIKGYNAPTQLTKFKNLSHIVFKIIENKIENETVASIAPWVKGNKNACVPHMIHLPECYENMRTSLGIPENAIVLGRIGGYIQFDIQFVYESIIENLNENIYYVFVNTRPFYDHPKIIYLNIITDLYEKVKFINTCDAMIHARVEGETFGLSIGEFSSCNKPVITSKSVVDNGHYNLMKDYAIWYECKQSLNLILQNISQIIQSRTDWNAYKDYSPEKVMKIFNTVFLNKKNELSPNFLNS